MISAEDQQRLTQVGPGTDCGEWLRSFWFPIALSDKWEGERAQLALEEPVAFKGRFEQGDVVFSERRSIFFKRMQIVRGCDVKRNVLVYVVYSDKLIEGSPKNSTSTVPIMPWGSTAEPAKCADWVDE